MEHIIAHYCLVAVALGSGLEGEPFALAVGIFARRRWISLQGAMLAAVAGFFLIDQFLFQLSRNNRDTRMVRTNLARPAFQRSLRLIERHPACFILLFRFGYGLRAITAVAVGATWMPTNRLLILNLTAATVWGILFTWLGYRAGTVIEAAEVSFGWGITVTSAAISLLLAAPLLRRGLGY